MNEVTILHGTAPRKILRGLLEKKMPVFMSYLVRANWSVARGLVTGLGEDRFDVKLSPQRRAKPINIHAGQFIGISFKYGYGGGYDKFVFDSIILDTGFSANGNATDRIILMMPSEIDQVPRRSYVRVEVPASLKISVEFWRRYCSSSEGKVTIAAGPRWDANLVDISVGGMQIAVNDVKPDDFRKGDSVGLRFTPMPHETPLMFNAQIKTVLPTADGTGICYGLQMVGLEASPEGRLVLARLAGIVEQYHQMNK
ncbi:MAG: PilZ domain-containing protein [Planctomycetota bacterium]